VYHKLHERAPTGAEPGTSKRPIEIERRGDKMSTTPAVYDDGFGDGSWQPRGVPANWDDQQGWHDRDGVPLPSPLLAIGVSTFLRRWHPKYEELRERPLPDVELLNSAIPQSEWRTGLDGKPEKPWKLNYEILLLDPATGTLYAYSNSTWGAQLCHGALQDKVMTMRMLRGRRVCPVVIPDKRPMPTSFGMKSKPHLQLTGEWRELPGLSGDTPPQTPPPALPPASQTASPQETPPAPAAPPSAPASAAPAASAAAQTTLDAMQPVKPVPIEEFIADSLPSWA
jgi:hypothetical protein